MNKDSTVVKVLGTILATAIVAALVIALAVGTVWLVRHVS